jgi:hypothetical protein
MESGGNDYLTQAGTAILYAVRRMREADLTVEDLQPGNYWALLAEVRRLLELANPQEDPHRFVAVKGTLETLEAHKRGENIPNRLEILRAHFEAVHGGPRNIDFGGIHVPNKPTVEQAFLRAAAVSLWDNFPEDRDVLLKEAKHILGIENKGKLAKLVENFHQRHDHELLSSKSPLSIHMPRVRELIEKFGYRSLQDFK